MIESIGDVIEDTLKNLGLRKSIEKQKALMCWDKVVGVKIATQTQAIRIKEKVLCVNTSSPVWAQELALMKNELIKKINLYLKEDAVKDIRFTGRGIRSNKKTIDNKQEDINEVVLTTTEITEINKTINHLKDEELKTKMKSILLADKKYKKKKSR